MEAVFQWWDVGVENLGLPLYFKNTSEFSAGSLVPPEKI